MCKCLDERTCFATDKNHNCTILSGKPYDNGACPFCKPKADMSNGSYYGNKYYDKPFDYEREMRRRPRP